MPHIIIECSTVLKPQAKKALKALHEHVTTCGLFNPQAVKGRMCTFEDEILPDGARNFMHVTISILQGRSEQERADLSKACFALAKRYAPDADRVSINIHEMAIATYSK